MIKTRIIQLFVVVLMVSGCSGTSSKAPQIAIQDAWSRAAGGMGGAGMDITPMPEAKPMQGMNGAVYLVLKNTGGAADN